MAGTGCFALSSIYCATTARRSWASGKRDAKSSKVRSRDAGSLTTTSARSKYWSSDPRDAASTVLRRRLDTVIAVTRATVRGMWWSKKTRALVARSKERRLSTTSVCPLKTNSPKTTFWAARGSLNDKVLASSVYSHTHRVWLASYSRQRNEAKRARRCSTSKTS